VPETVPTAETTVNDPTKVSGPTWAEVLAPRVSVITSVDDETGELTPRLVAETVEELAKVQVVAPPDDKSASDGAPDELCGEMAETVDDRLKRLTAASD